MTKRKKMGAAIGAFCAAVLLVMAGCGGPASPNKTGPDGYVEVDVPRGFAHVPPAGDGSLKFKWNPVNGATEYQMTIDGSKPYADVAITAGEKEVTAVLTKLTNGQKYDVQARAGTGGNWSIWTARISVTLDWKPAEAVALLDAAGEKINTYDSLGETFKALADMDGGVYTAEILATRLDSDGVEIKQDGKDITITSRDAEVVAKSDTLFTAQGGNITVNKTKLRGRTGTAQSQPLLKVEGGSFALGEALELNGYGGPAAAVTGGAFVMNGTAKLSGFSAGVKVSGGMFTMEGQALIKGNTAYGVELSGGTLALKGSAVIEGNGGAGKLGIKFAGGELNVSESAAVSEDNIVDMAAGKVVTIEGALTPHSNANANASAAGGGGGVQLHSPFKDTEPGDRRNAAFYAERAAYGGEHVPL